ADVEGLRFQDCSARGRFSLEADEHERRLSRDRDQAARSQAAELLPGARRDEHHASGKARHGVEESLVRHGQAQPSDRGPGGLSGLPELMAQPRSCGDLRIGLAPWWRRSQVVRQRSAKPPSPAQFWALRPNRNQASEALGDPAESTNVVNEALSVLLEGRTPPTLSCCMTR